MYCYVIFGASDNHHTRNYLYSCENTLVPGDIVIVPAKNTTKIALVKAVFDTYPENLNIDKTKVKSMISKSDKMEFIIYHQIPAMSVLYIEKPGAADQKELGFWKELKDIEYKLLYGFSFWEKDQHRFHPLNEDPIEYEDKYLLHELELERLIRKEIGEGGYRGYCHLYWYTKKKILKDKFGIDWKSPQELNPTIIFD